MNNHERNTLKGDISPEQPGSKESGKICIRKTGGAALNVVGIEKPEKMGGVQERGEPTPKEMLGDILKAAKGLAFLDLAEGRVDIVEVLCNLTGGSEENVKKELGQVDRKQKYETPEGLWDSLYSRNNSETGETSNNFVLYFHDLYRNESKEVDNDSLFNAIRNTKTRKKLDQFDGVKEVMQGFYTLFGSLYKDKTADDRRLDELKVLAGGSFHELQKAVHDVYKIALQLVSQDEVEKNDCKSAHERLFQ